MASTPQRGPGIGLPRTPGTYTTYLNSVFNNEIPLQAGATYIIPAGQWIITPGVYTMLQFRDPVTNVFRGFANATNDPTVVSSDGTNFRLANFTGYAIGASVTNVGSGYTSVPTVTGGGATWQAFVGGTVTGITVGTAGAGYTLPPMVFIDPPPPGGLQATATATLSTGTVSAVTLLDQGAGYTTAPTVYLVADPRDTGPTTAALATSAIGGSGTITALLVTNHGTTLNTSVPSLTFTGGGGSAAAATAVMCFAVTGATQTVAGVAYTNSSAFQVRSFGGVVAASTVAKQPSWSTGSFVPRTASIVGSASGAGAIGTTQLTAATVVDGGLCQAVPSAVVDSAGAVAPSTIAQVAVTVGSSAVDVSLVQPF